MYKINKLIMIYLLFFVIPQDIILSILYKIGVSANIIKVIIGFKDIIIYFLAYQIIIQSKRFNKNKATVLIMYVFYFCIILLLPYDNSIGERIYSFRSIFNIFVLYYIGRNINLLININDFKKIITLIFTKYINIIVILSLILYIIPSDLIWIDIVGIGKYMQDIKGYTLVYGYPGNFFGDYGNGYFSTLRLAGVAANPLTMAYYLAIFMMYYLLKLKKSRRDYISMIIIGICIILTKTRIIIMLTVVIGMYFIIKRTNLGKLTFFSFIIPIFIIILVNNHSMIFDASGLGHIEALKNAINNIDIKTLFGLGYGTAGAAAITQSGGISTESAYFTIFIQLGVLGLCMYIIFMAYSLQKIYVNIGRNENKNLGYSIIASGYIYIITGFISEQIISFSTIYTFYILLGVSNNFKNLNEISGLV